MEFDWIKCCEKMPEEYPKSPLFYSIEKKSRNVLITVEFEDGSRAIDIAFSSNKSWINTDGTLYYRYGDGKRKCEVIAWTELPSPCKR